jgi:methanogenic corrinoid protein MtbC1
MAALRQQVADSFDSEAGSGFTPATAAPGVARRHLVLARAIETVVIPRMVQAHRSPVADGFAAAAAAGVLTADSVLEFARLILGNEMPGAASYLAAMRARGAALETLYLDLLAPVARHLGALWEEDLCDFAQVTAGLWRLHQVLRDSSAGFDPEPRQFDLNHHALLVPAPAEQHTFGLAMVADFFRRAGWGVWSGAPESVSDLLAMVRDEWFAVVGFSVACGLRLEALEMAIRQVRRVSCNRTIGIMVGGPLFVAHPELVAQVGADATAADGRQAVLNAAALLGRLTTGAQRAGSRAVGRT